MAEEVVNPVAEESLPVTEAQAPVVDATQGDEDLATWKKRLAGKDQALTSTKKELEAKASELEALRKWKAEVEQANMTELEKAQSRVTAMESELNAAREATRREAIARKHPLFAQFATDTQGLDVEAQAAAFEKFVANVAREPQKADAFVDVNAPRKSAPQAAAKPDSKSLSDSIRAIGNPFYDGK